MDYTLDPLSRGDLEEILDNQHYMACAWIVTVPLLSTGEARDGYGGDSYHPRIQDSQLRVLTPVVLPSWPRNLAWLRQSSQLRFPVAPSYQVFSPAPTPPRSPDTPCTRREGVLSCRSLHIYDIACVRSCSFLRRNPRRFRPHSAGGGLRPPRIDDCALLPISATCCLLLGLSILSLRLFHDRIPGDARWIASTRIPPACTLPSSSAQYQSSLPSQLSQPVCQPPHFHKFLCDLLPSSA